MDFEISADADELHQAALKSIMKRAYCPDGVKFPDGFRAGEGMWATIDKPIPKLVPFSKDFEDYSAVWKNEMSRAWMEGAVAILCDFRIDFGDSLFGSVGARSASKVAERMYPGILEASGAAYCIRQCDEFYASVKESRLDEELAGWFGSAEETIEFCKSLDLYLDHPMHRFASLEHGFYAQKSLRKSFESRNGRSVLSSPWSWSDFESHCEEIFFSSIRRNPYFDRTMASIFSISGSAVSRMRSSIDAACAEKEIFPSYMGAGQAYRVIWEMSNRSPETIGDHYMAEWIGATAMYSISRGGNRSMDRKIQKYLNGEMSKNRRR